MSRFVCLGADCPDHCCAGWKVELFSDEYHSVKQFLDSKNNECTDLSSVMKIEECIETDSRSNRIFFKQSKGLCAMQTSTGLCGLQEKMGHSALPSTCSSFPRAHFAWKKGGDEPSIHQIGGYLSCSEVARAVLDEDEECLGLMESDNQHLIRLDACFEDSSSIYVQSYFKLQSYFLSFLEENGLHRFLSHTASFASFSPAFFNKHSSQ